MLSSSEIHIRGLGGHPGVWLGHNFLRGLHLQHAQVCQGAPRVRRHLQLRRLLQRTDRLRRDDLRRSGHYSTVLTDLIFSL